VRLTDTLNDDFFVIFREKVAKNFSTYSLSRSLPLVRKLPTGNITHPLLACHVWLSRIYKVLRNSYLQAVTQTFSHFFL
jgi:hypothetical protein